MVTSYDNACDEAVHEPYLLNRVELINTLCSCHLWHLDRITLQKCKHPLLKAQAQGTKCGRQIDATTQEQMSATGVCISQTLKAHSHRRFEEVTQPSWLPRNQSQVVTNGCFGRKRLFWISHAIAVAMLLNQSAAQEQEICKH